MCRPESNKPYNIDLKNDSKHSQIRKDLRDARRSLNKKQQNLAAKKLLALVLEDNDFKEAKTIAIYQAFDGEIDPSLVLQTALDLGKRCFLPNINFDDESMAFVEFRSDSSLTENHFGILEPKLISNETLSSELIDVMFLPLVAFDRSGTRLGMGKGYYDRNLAFISKRCSEMSLSSKKKPKLIGLAHECQRVDQLERAEWDVPMNKIITDQTSYSVTD